MHKLILLAGGGAIGTLGRYAVSGIAQRHFGISFPYGTLAVNLFGSLLIGLLWGLFDYYNLSSGTRIFLFIGILGSFTTFSTFMLENLNIFRNGEIKLALLNILANNLLGLICVFLGFAVMRELISWIR